MSPLGICCQAPRSWGLRIRKQCMGVRMHQVFIPISKRRNVKWLAFAFVCGSAAAQPLVVDRISPLGAAVGTPGLILDVYGGPFCRTTPFDNASLVAWNDVTLNTLFVDDRHLQANVPASLLSVAATVAVRVKNVHCVPANTVSNVVLFPIAGPPTITTHSLAAGVVGSPYSDQLAASGGVSPYVWSVDSSSPVLPSGLTLSSTGLISGTPTQKFDGVVTVTASDSSGPIPQTVSATLSLVVTAPPFQVVMRLPRATVGEPYHAALTAAGGVPPYSWTMAPHSSALPNGIALDATGSLSGTPLLAGTFVFTLELTDSLGDSDLRSFSLTVRLKRLIISAVAGLPPATVGLPYAYRFVVTGGTPPYAWTAEGLPPGIALSSTTGVLSGTPQVASATLLLIRVSDAAGQTAQTHTSFLAVFPRAGTLAIIGLPANAAPLSRHNISASISQSYPVALTGTLQLKFSSSSGVDDPEVQFTGALRSIPFVIAPGTTQAMFPPSGAMVETGTVAGIIELVLSVDDPSGGAPIITSASTVVPEAPPVIVSSAILSNNANAQRSLALTAYSTTREVQALRLTPVDANGEPVSTHTVDLSSVVSTWFTSSSSISYGGEFSITVPLSTVSDASGIHALSVILVNSRGPSQPSLVSWR